MQSTLQHFIKVCLTFQILNKDIISIYADTKLLKS